MAKMAIIFKRACLTFLTTATIWVVVQGGGGACPDLTPVGVDTKLIKSLQPAHGFHANLVAGVDKMPNFESKPMKKVSGKTKVCYNVKLKVSGNELFDAPPVECNGPSASQFYCTMPKLPGVISAAGIRAPQNVLNTIVDTDNKTYLAMGGCLDGSVYMWAILNVKQGNKKVKESTLKALHITVKDVKESEGKKYKNGQTKITLGGCQGGGGMLGGLLDG